jgi:AraC-like DNA-binding protein
VDVLSDVLRVVRLTGAVYFDVHARAPWVAESPPGPTICAGVMPEFEHLICFHIVMSGACWVQLADESQPAIRLDAGDAVIFAGGDGHVMASEPGKRSVPNMDLYQRPKDATLPFSLSELGGKGDETRFVCGYFGCNARPFNPIIRALPRIFHSRCATAGGNLTHDLVRVALQETNTAGTGREAILSKLSELMFLHAVRRYIDALPEESVGWLAGLRDRYVLAALRLMHGDPAQAWTLDRLAREIGLSRSAFAEHFARIMGVPPMQYLGNWRLQVAASLLEQSGKSLAQVAADIGYDSDSAFSRAFRKQTGVPPGAWRRGVRTAP